MTAILDIQLDNAQAVAEEILSQGGKKSIAVKMDVTDSQEVKRAVREVEETFGRVDVLINNVSREELGLFIDSTEESWDWKIEGPGLSKDPPRHARSDWPRASRWIPPLGLR